MDLKVSLCWERYKPCQFMADVFQNTMIPKRKCMGRLSYEKPGILTCVFIVDNVNRKYQQVTSRLINFLKSVLRILIVKLH